MLFLDMIENSLILAPNSTLSPYSKVDTANGMPINGLELLILSIIILGLKNTQKKKTLKIFMQET